MFSNEQSKEDRVKVVQKIIAAVTGTEVESGRAERILTAFESFQAFVESGQSFKDLQNDVADIQAVGTFQEFVSARGGALVGNEIWVLLAYMNWCESGHVFTGTEGRLMQTLKELVLSKKTGRRFNMDKETATALQNVIEHWVGGER